MLLLLVVVRKPLIFLLCHPIHGVWCASSSMVGLLLLQVWCPYSRSPMVRWTKNSASVQETRGTQVWSLGQEDHLEKEMATHSSILAWKIPWAEEPGGLQSVGSQRVRHNWASKYANRWRGTMKNRGPKWNASCPWPCLKGFMEAPLRNSFWLLSH